jgi:hypothetical protein
LAVASAAAAREVEGEGEGEGEVTVPSFDLLVRPALAAGHSPVPIAAPGPDLRRSGRLALALAVAQLRLLPRSFLPMALLGFAGSVLLAVLAAPTGLAAGLFGLAVTLVVQLSAVTACARRADPRFELPATLPVGPATVYAIRLVVVLGVNAVLALTATGVAARLGGTADFAELAATWFGQSLLASAVAVVGAVWRSAAAGTTAGVTLWLLGAVCTVSDGGLTRRLGEVVAPLWTTSPLTVVVALLLLSVAVPGMRWPEHRLGPS